MGNSNDDNKDNNKDNIKKIIDDIELIYEILK